MLQTLFSRGAAAPARRTMTQRFASSTSEASQKKAQDAFATAQATAGKVLAGAKKALGPVGEKVGEMLGAYKQPILYNLSVAKHLAKTIYVREGLAPPSLAAVRAAYADLVAQASNPALFGNLIKSGEAGRVAVYGLQAYGIFKIGEIIGRKSLVGYKLK